MKASVITESKALAAFIFSGAWIFRVVTCVAGVGAAVLCERVGTGNW